jgi:hypothetical protein
MDEAENVNPVDPGGFGLVNCRRKEWPDACADSDSDRLQFS